MKNNNKKEQPKPTPTGHKTIREDFRAKGVNRPVFDLLDLFDDMWEKDD